MELSDATGEKNPATPGIDPGTFRLVAQLKKLTVAKITRNSLGHFDDN
jgi:hypothetical protein